MQNAHIYAAFDIVVVLVKYSTLAPTRKPRPSSSPEVKIVTALYTDIKKVMEAESKA